MKQKFFHALLILLAPFMGFAQTVPKDARVDVTMIDKTGKIVDNSIVVFRSNNSMATEYQGLTDATGKFSLRLPQGAKYEIFILGFKDSTSYMVLDIPALKDNQFYPKDRAAFKVDIQFEPPKSFVLEGCNFETGKATLQPESYKVLDELVEYLEKKNDDKIEIGGHTDDIGKAAANMILSQNRANTVKAYLLTKGIAPERVTAKGYGMDEPIEDNSTAAGRAKNRRTEVKIVE
ncbi:MAG: OmpA family protein [Sphingobacteriales bacterium]|nr:OmpA family protein [Sphingobacteriales bacterium]